VFGNRSLKLETAGETTDEGAYTTLFAAVRGEHWTFTVWLQGAEGGELVNVSLWEYGLAREGRAQGNIPITLTDEMRGYVVKRGLIDPGTTQVRALVRTRLRPQAMTVYIDGAHLQRQEAAPGSALPSAGEPGAGAPQLEGESSNALDYVTGPLLGLGFGRTVEFNFDGIDYVVEGDPHSGFVYLLAGGGILALGGFLILTAVFLRDSIGRLRVAAGSDRALLVWTLAVWATFMVNALTGIIFTEPRFILTIWTLMLLPALVGPAPAALGQERSGVHGAPRPRELDSGDDEGEATDVVASGRLGNSTLPHRRRKFRQRARALFRRDRDERDRPGKGTPPDSAP
jgi:hypothetical protein